MKTHAVEQAERLITEGFYVLVPYNHGSPAPSQLCGVMKTKKDEKKYRLSRAAGFRAAYRTANVRQALDSQHSNVHLQHKGLTSFQIFGTPTPLFNAIAFSADLAHNNHTRSICCASKWYRPPTNQSGQSIVCSQTVVTQRRYWIQSPKRAIQKSIHSRHVAI